MKIVLLTAVVTWFAAVYFANYGQADSGPTQAGLYRSPVAKAALTTSV